MASISSTSSSFQSSDLPRGHADSELCVSRDALDKARASLGGSNAWITRHDSDGCEVVMLLDPAGELDPARNSRLDITDNTWSHGAAEVKPWKDDTLLCASFVVGRGPAACGYSVGILFAGRFELTEYKAGLVEGLRCSLHAFFTRAFSSAHMSSHSSVAPHSIVCSCCRRAHSLHHGWMHWDDLRFVETGIACSHTVCEQCASQLYQDVLTGEN